MEKQILTGRSESRLSRDMICRIRKSLLQPAAGCAILSVILMTWLAAASDRWSDAFSFTGQQEDYYNLLVDGFQDGHLHMKVAVHPDRLSSDPEIRKRAPYALDAALYRNHYYLYYGVVPAVTVLLPYSILTGHDLSLNVVTLGFVTIGFLLSLTWYFSIRRSHFSAVPAAIDCAVVLLLAFGPATTFLVRRAMFYELPLAAGYAFFCGFLWTISRALQGPAGAHRWLAGASLCLGFAAGCHPNYAFLTPLLALAAWWIYRDAPAGEAGRPAAIRLAKAAVLPAAAIGAMLALYNFARFGNPLEFGFNYGVNVFFETGDKLMSAGFLWPNLKWYYLTPPTLLPYFPFVFPADATFRPPGYHGAEAIHGQFLVFVLFLWVTAGLARYFRAASWPALTRRLLFVLAGAFLAAAGFILLLGIRANRYMVDFQMPLIALCVLLLATVGQVQTRDRFMRLWRGGLVILAGLVACGNLLAAVQQFDQFAGTRPRTFHQLGRMLNPSWAFWAKLGLVRTGTLAMDVTFQSQSKPVGEPLLTVGVPGYSDSVYALQYPGNKVEFLIEHAGFGGMRSGLLAYKPGERHRLQIELGSFFPPKTDPALAGLPRETVRRIKTTVRLVFDDQVAIDKRMMLFDAAPWQREIGSNLTTSSTFSRRFSGTISEVRWLPPSDHAQAPGAAPARSCLLRLSATFPPDMPPANQPLVGFGFSGEGSLLFLRPAGPGLWDMAVDEWGHASSPPARVRIPAGEHTIDVFIGPLAAADSSLAQSDLPERLAPHHQRLLVWIDGSLVGNFRLNHHLDSFGSLFPGANPQGFSTSETSFYGQTKESTLSDSEREQILQKILDLRY